MANLQLVTQVLPGRLFARRGRGVIWLEEGGGRVVWVRYALVTLGVEEHIFPSFLLDDWGNERRGPQLYQWIRDNGMMFPRAEIFGMSAAGVEEQLFLRELELHVRLPAYAVPAPDAPVVAGIPVEAVCLPAEAALAPIDIPAAVQPPLRYIRAHWWHGSQAELLAEGFGITPPGESV
jgi:hypothetical protein